MLTEGLLWSFCCKKTKNDNKKVAVCEVYSIMRIDAIVSKTFYINTEHCWCSRTVSFSNSLCISRFYSSVGKLHLQFSILYLWQRLTALQADVRFGMQLEKGHKCPDWCHVIVAMWMVGLKAWEQTSFWREINQHECRVFFDYNRLFLHSFLPQMHFLFPGLIAILSDVVMCCT